MNILYVIQNYLPFVGGIETQVQLFSRTLAKRHCVTVAAGNFAPNRLPPRLGVLFNSLLASRYADYWDGDVQVRSLTPNLPDRARMLPIAVRALPVAQRYAYHGLNRFGYRFYRSVYVPRLRKMMAGMDVVHATSGGYIGWAAQEAAHSLGLPFVCTPYVHPKQWGDGPDDLAYYKRCEAVIGLLESDRQNLMEIGVPKGLLKIIGVIPIVSDHPDPMGFRQKHDFIGKPFVLFVGRITAYKGVQAMLHAAPEIWKSQPDAHLVFVGPANPEEAAWFENADPRIHYLGKLSDQEKSNALAACDVFCMPSTSEILPAVYLEAWSYGKPVIGGKAHGLPELIEGNGGGVTVEQNALDVAEAIIKILCNAELSERFGASGKRLVADNYSLEAVTGQLETLYQSLTRTGKLLAASQGERA